jgi:hypothetical protein
MVIRFAGAIAFIFVVVGTWSWAGSDENINEALMGVCRTDFNKYCEGQPEPSCLKQNHQNFSHGCQTEMNRRLDRIKSVRIHCKADTKKYCSNVKGPDLMMCLKLHENKLAHTCRAALPEREVAFGDEQHQPRKGMVKQKKGTN